MAKKEKRFIMETSETVSFGTSAMVFTDRDTGVQYLYIGNGYGGGLTPLLNAEGKPVTTKGKTAG